MSWLATWVASGDARRRWALATLLEAAGIPARAVDDPSAARPGPLLAYGDVAPGPDRCVIPVDEGAPLAWPEAMTMPGVDAAALGAVLPVDVVRQVERMLTDEPHAEASREDRDRHGRLQFRASTPERHGLGSVAIIDRTANVVAAWLESQLAIRPVPRWPDGARAAVVLSHDVDHPDRYGILRAVLRDPRRVRSAPRTLTVRALYEARLRLRDRAPGEFWAFDALVRSEAARGFTSTYLFSSMPFHGPWGTTLDVAYDVAEPRFRPVFEQLAGSGNEIGLHAGYAAHAARGRIAAERRRLERAANQEIRGVRHHYWQLGPDPAATFAEQQAAGLAWDSSLAFNDHPGFRRSISLPFSPWDPASERPLALLEIPTACMDGSLLYRHEHVDAAVAAVDALLSEVTAAGGALVLDWHLQASVVTNREYRAWAEAYQAILDVVAAKRDMWVTALDRLDRWWTNRRATLRLG
jgi:hypothetical protein